MFDPFHRLFAEQTTPLELTLFIIMVAAACVLVAAVIYVAVMFTLWARRLRSEVSLKQLFLPTLENFKEFLPEYLLAIGTSIVIAVTIAEKHEIVDAVLSYDAATLSAHDVEGLFPLHRIPNARELDGDTQAETNLRETLQGESLRSAGVYAHSVLKPALEAGRAGEVRRLLGLIVPQVIDTPRTKRLLRRGLLGASLLLIVGYLIWLGRSRVQRLKESPDGSVSYGSTTRRIAIIGVSLALLLASPALVSDSELIADSTLGVLRHQAEETSELDRQIRLGVDAQYDLQSALRALAGIEEGESIPETLAHIDAHLATVDTLDQELEPRLAALQEALDAAQRSLGSLQVRLDAQSGVIDGLESDIAGLEADITVHGNRLDGQDGRITALGVDLGEVANDVAANGRRLDRLAGLEDDLTEALEASGAELRADLNRLAAEVAGTSGTVDEIGTRLGNLERLLETLSQSADGREGMELLLVTTARRYTILRGSTPHTAGARWGLHWLPTRVNFVAVAGDIRVPFNLQPGQPRVLELIEAVGQLQEGGEDRD